MSKAVFQTNYKLKKRADVPDFLQAFEALKDGFVSEQTGFVSWQLMKDGEVWSDAITFETMEDLENFEKASANPNELALTFYGFLNVNSCKTQRFTIEKE